MASILIIPAYNPDERLLALVRRLQELDGNQQILIVNDGSDPRSEPVFDQLRYGSRCILCTHPENYGKGAALKTGIAYILRHYPNCTGFLTADADGQHLAADILRVAAALRRQPDHLVLGVRDFSGEQVPRKSRWGNRITSAVFRWVTGRSCPDTQTGLRGVPAVYAPQALDIPGERYEYEMNLLLWIAGEGAELKEVPIRTLYHEQNRGSHFRPVRDSVRIYSRILRYWVGGKVMCGGAATGKKAVS